PAPNIQHRVRCRARLRTSMTPTPRPSTFPIFRRPLLRLTPVKPPQKDLLPTPR
ncbi:hypothetical protein CH063_12957, partial [Colletotrichum higginsianum]